MEACLDFEIVHECSRGAQINKYFSPPLFVSTFTFCCAPNNYLLSPCMTSTTTGAPWPIRG